VHVTGEAIWRLADLEAKEHEYCGPSRDTSKDELSRPSLPGRSTYAGCRWRQRNSRRLRRQPHRPAFPCAAFPQGHPTLPGRQAKQRQANHAASAAFTPAPAVTSAPVQECLPPEGVSAHAVFTITYAIGEVEEIEADECLEMGRHLTFVNHRFRFVWTAYTEIVRRLDRRAVIRVDEVVRPLHRTNWGAHPEGRSHGGSTTATTATTAWFDRASTAISLLLSSCLSVAVITFFAVPTAFRRMSDGLGLRCGCTSSMRRQA
jgi:hypothetical protein